MTDPVSVRWATRLPSTSLIHNIYTNASLSNMWLMKTPAERVDILPLGTRGLPLLANMGIGVLSASLSRSKIPLPPAVGPNV